VNVLETMMRLVFVGVCIVGLVTLASPWLQRVERLAVPPGWTCWDVTRSTSTESERSKHCSPQYGWRAVRLPDGGAVAVPDWHYVRE
jgi:hypothetical protein